jgi:uncharacterized membrane protein YfcA
MRIIIMSEYMHYLTLPNLSLIGVGIIIATFASLVGIGGGLLWAPYLILVAKFDPYTAVMLSFLIQLAGMGSATLENIRSGNIFWKLALILMPFIILGVIGGSYLSRMFAESEYIEMGLGISGIIVSLIFAFQTESYDEDIVLDRKKYPPLYLLPISTIFGSISGMFSIGIGDFLIPLVRGRMKVPMRFTVGTNLFLNFTIALIGATSHYFIGKFIFTEKILTVLAFSWVGVILGGQIGPRLARHITDNRLKEIFIFVLLLIGIHLIYQSL